MSEELPVEPPVETVAETVARPALSEVERRVLGVLIEKAKTTPDAYPLSLNGLITGCNQKSNRDPVMNLQDHDLDEAIANLKRLGLVQQITGSGRTDKYRHVVYDAWKVDKVQLAILGELLLRGAQTEGELRGRASRMEPIAELEELRSQLKTLAQRGMVVYLTPEGRRGTTVTHGFHPADELERLRAGAALNVQAESVARPRGTAPADSGLTERIARLEEGLEALRAEFAQWKAERG